MFRALAVAPEPAAAAAPAPGSAPEGEVTLCPRVRLMFWYACLGGWFDLTALVFKKEVIKDFPFYFLSRHFYWRVPLACSLLALAAGLLALAIGRLLPLRLRTPLVVFFVSLTVFLEFAARMPIAKLAGMLFAGGLAGMLARKTAANPPKCVRYAGLKAGLAGGLLIAVIAVSTGWEAYSLHRARAARPLPVKRAKNVILLVLDAVRAQSLSLYGYDRKTTPNLELWAKRGLRFDNAIAPVSWTLPAHASMFSGLWPYQFQFDWKSKTPFPGKTLAGFLADQGYDTVGFASNTVYCSYETGLDAGFLEYYDFLETAENLISETYLGGVLVESLSDPAGLFAAKFRKSRSRDAAGLRLAVGKWIENRRAGDRPFFAFVNYLDGHEPFVTPRTFPPPFGPRPLSSAQRKLIKEWWHTDKTTLSEAVLNFVREQHDNALAWLDGELGALLNDLDRSGTLDDSIVIIAGDHGESLGEHHLFNHGSSLYMPEVHVPLVIIAPGLVAAGASDGATASLRDIPATIAGLLGLESPFPGRSLVLPDRRDAVALSEVSGSFLYTGKFGREPSIRGAKFALAGWGMRYVRDDSGVEELFDLKADPGEERNLAPYGKHSDLMRKFRSRLLELLDACPPIRYPNSGPAAEFQKKLRLFEPPKK